MRVKGMISYNERDEALSLAERMDLKIPEKVWREHGICTGEDYMKILRRSDFYPAACGVIVVGNLNFIDPVPVGANRDLNFEGMTIYGRVSLIATSFNSLSFKDALLLGDGFIAVRVTVDKDMYYPKNWEDLKREQPQNINIQDLNVKGRMIFP